MVLWCGRSFGEGAPPASPPTPRRLVSLAPSITEIVFALEQGDRLVGVTRFCDHPAAAAGIAKVGGFVDPNYEAIVALAPDAVFLLASQRDARTRLEALRLRTVSTPNQTIQDIQLAIHRIGEACEVGPAAEALLSRIDLRTRAVKDAVRHRPRSRVLLCVGRDMGSGTLSGMYVAGRRGFHDQIIELAGGLNACTNAAFAFPQISAEGVIQLDPDVIVDLRSESVSGKTAPGDGERPWSRLGMVAAVRNSRIHSLIGNQALRPGPRYVDFLEQLARLLHPEAFPDPGHHESPGHHR